MTYDELTLRPAQGGIDVTAVNSWLAAQPHAFLDPIAGDGWHIGGSAEEMQRNLAARIEDPQRFPTGVRVFVSAEQIAIAKWVPMFAELRMLEFVCWLVRDGHWLVKRDWGAYEPLADPRRLFPIGLGDRDHTDGEVTEGVRVDVAVGDRIVVVHSGGQWRWARQRGQLAPEALAEWNAAVAALRGREDVFRAYQDPDTVTGCIVVESPDEFEVANFDAAQVPEALRPLQALAERFVADL